MIVATASRAALLNFRERWIAMGGPNAGLDINRCTANGGLCEHPQQLEYCGKSSSVASLHLLLMLFAYGIHLNVGALFYYSVGVHQLTTN